MIDLSGATILIRGGGDLATGVAIRLYRSGFPVAITELLHPLMVRRTVSFGEAVNDGRAQVEGISAMLVDSAEEAKRQLNTRDGDRIIPVLVDPEACCRSLLRPLVIVDAIMAKRNIGTSLADAPFVVALGPGFTAGVDCHAVIETNRGHCLGRVIREGMAARDTGVPGEIGGKSTERLLRAPVAGTIEEKAQIGQRVVQGQIVAEVAGQGVQARIDGVLRGLTRSGIYVSAGLKVGDVDPRAQPAHCYLVSDKSLAIGGGVLEAVMGFITQRSR